MIATNINWDSLMARFIQYGRERLVIFNRHGVALEEEIILITLSSKPRF